MLKEQRNSKKKGDVGLGAAIAYFTRMGYCVCLPLTDSQEYDLIVDIDKILHKVQVKTTTHKKKSGVYSVELRTLDGLH
jgi:Holliday junction resolvase-like predicted endonuclease